MDDIHYKGDGSNIIRYFNEIYYKDQKDTKGDIRTPFLRLNDGDTDEVCFVVYCSKCHSGLCKGIVIGRSRIKRENIILIGPCPYCTGQAEKRD